MYQDIESTETVCYNTRKSRLYHKTRQGVLSHIRKGVYLPSNVNDKFVIACQAVADGCLVYHSALEYYALHTQSFNWLYVHSTTPFRSFEYLNETYIYKPVPTLVNPIVDSANSQYQVKVTSLSQTIIDCIRRIDLAGGLEELLHALQWIDKGNLNEDDMIACLDFSPSKSTYQRAGFLLSQFNDGLGLSDGFFKHCKERIGCNVCYLSADEDCDAFDNEWKICVPKSLRKQKEYGQY